MSNYTKEQILDLKNKILQQNTTALAKSITLIESQKIQDREFAKDLLNSVYPSKKTSTRIGISGVPGAGKSSLIEALGLELCKQGFKVAVLAIDPSSQISGGSILGDKTRMNELAIHPNAFIRPSPSKGFLGGVHERSLESIHLCEAAGYDYIIVETVGVGQSETAVADIVDLYLVIMLTGSGDDLQGIKRGIMEMADMIAINKADGDNLLKAQAAKSELDLALKILRPKDLCQVYLCSALQKTGVKELLNHIQLQIEDYKKNGNFDLRRKNQLKKYLWNSLKTELLQNLFAKRGLQQITADLEDQLIHLKIHPAQAVYELIQKMLK